MNKKILGLTLVCALALPVLAMAATPSGTMTISTFITQLKNAAWIVFGIIALIAFVIAGILFLTAAGDPEKIATARTAFLWGVVGIVVGIVAYSIMTIVQGLFPG